jgi:hypothetical protein
MSSSFPVEVALKQWLRLEIRIAMGLREGLFGRAKIAKNSSFINKFKEIVCGNMEGPGASYNAKVL